VDKVLNIYILKNCIFKNKLTEQMFDKQEVMIIEYANGKKSILDLKDNADKTSLFNNNLDLIINKGKTKLKVLFRGQ
jgi:hypothetical protein